MTATPQTKENICHSNFKMFLENTYESFMISIILTSGMSAGLYI
jgi:hypothetical protein